MASNNRSNRPSNGARTRGSAAAPAARAQGRRQSQRRQEQRPSQQQRPSQRAERQAATAPSPRSGGGLPARALWAIQGNPIPALMIGAGLTWMLLGDRIGSALDTGAVRRGRRALGELGETFADSFGSAAEETASHVRDGLVTIRDYAQEGLDTAGQALRGGAGAVGRGARRAVSSTADAVGNTWDNHPLGVCAAVFAAGVTAGMLLPATQPEARALGRASNAMVKQARRSGARVLKQGKRIAAEAVEVAGREARRQGLTASDLGAKVKRVASKARDAIAAE